MEKTPVGNVGTTGKTVGENVARMRKTQRLSLKELEGLLARHGRRISFSGLSKIENGTRKVDTDDLMALALALDVSPVALLLPQGDPQETVDVTGGRGSLGVFWEWAFGGTPLINPDWRSYEARSLPSWLMVQPEFRRSGRLELVFGLPGEEPAHHSTHVFSPTNDG
jgi:transcriptional regulator with XRE-family HTH domain